MIFFFFLESLAHFYQVPTKQLFKVVLISYFFIIYVNMCEVNWLVLHVPFRKYLFNIAQSFDIKNICFLFLNNNNYYILALLMTYPSTYWLKMIIYLFRINLFVLSIIVIKKLRSQWQNNKNQFLHKLSLNHS